jgi:hypothetical protein
MTIDPKTPRDSTGVVAADLSDATYVRGQLDIPHRSLVESDHTYGGVAGHRVSIPFIITLDYILTDRLVMVALGDGLLDKAAVAGTPAPPPVFALDLIVPGLSEAAWQYVIANLTDEWLAKRATSLLQRWHDGHLRVTIDHDALVLEASGNRR